MWRTIRNPYLIASFHYIMNLYRRDYVKVSGLTSNNRTYTIDEDAEAILKEIPKKKKSEFVREAIKLKARTLESDEKQPQKQAEKPIPTVKISI